MKYIYVIYAAILFCLLFLIMLPFILLFCLFGSWGRKASWRLVQIWAYIWFTMVGIFNENIYEAKPNKNKPYIVIANHISYLDTPVIFRAIPFYVRPLATFEYSKIPLFGILYKQLAVLIDRKNLQSKTDGVRTLRTTLDEGSSIFIFPEGAFNETNKILKPFFDGAFKIAVQTNTAILPVLFLDTHKLWSYKSFWALRPGKNRVVFLPEINPTGYENDILAYKTAVFNKMKFALEQYKLK